jgi:hypothetical protein
MMVAPGLVAPASASHVWISIGTAFRIGPAFISFVLAPPTYGYPGYFYRFDRPIRYGGAHCSRYCFHEGGYYYHDASCPLVAAHFSYYNVDPYWAYGRYAPRYDGGYYGYDGYGRGGGYGYYDRRGNDGYYGYRDDHRYRDRYYDRRGYDGYYDYRGRDRHYDRYDDRRGYDRDHRSDRDRGHRDRGHGHGHHKGHGDS